MKKTVVAGALGECVHVAGVMSFLRLAELAGWRTVFLGPAVPIDVFLSAIKREKADLVGVSYRLTPETGERLLGSFAESADDLFQKGVHFAFGGTPPVAEKVRKLGFFERVFDGSESDAAVLAYLKGDSVDGSANVVYPATTIARIHWKSPFPLLRHHFGLPSMDATLRGVKEIADSGVLDVISLGIDQDAQEYYFHPEKQDPRRKGAGGVPVRSDEDYLSLYQASRSGNQPLMRTYAGTDDFIRLAEVYQDTIRNAWCAIPLFWFNQLDRRGPWDLEGSIRQHQLVMRWHGERNIPVELNEPHHWGMRDAPDVVSVVSAYLSAYNARVMGVKDYIAQLMFNCPPGLSDAMDLAKMLAIRQLIEPLRSRDFNIWYQTRTGLLSYPLEINAAQAHLSSSIYLQMALKPDIIHVVSHVEADHAATPQDVIEACKMAQRAIETALKGQPDMLNDPAIQNRAGELVREAAITLDAIRRIQADSGEDPLTDPVTLAGAVTRGILDAPHLRNSPIACGRIKTSITAGQCVSVDEKGEPLPEAIRIAQILDIKGRSE
jgi:hypothetical protein